MAARTKKEPLFHIVRRDTMPYRRKAMFRGVSIFLAFLVCALFLVFYKGYNPFAFIGTLFSGTIGDSFNLFVFLGELAILLGFGLALVPAFKMKFWNIGADGQALVGALSAYLVLYFGTVRGNMPGFIACIVALLAAILAGAIWGVIPAVFKAYWNTNETLFTLMMNYIAIQLALFVKYYIVFVLQKGNKTTIPIPSDGMLPSVGGIDQIFTIIIVAIIAVLVVVYVNKTKQGYELSLVGDSENSAKYAGINVKWVIIRTMIISGAIAGLIGWLLIVGEQQAVAEDITRNMGFTAIIVAWLAKFNPVYMILTAGLVAFFTIGMKDVTASAGITSDAITNIFIGVLFFFILAFEFFISYKIILRKNEDGEIDNKALCWNYNKIYIPVAKFFDFIFDKVDQFFAFLNKKIKGLFKKENKVVKETNSTATPDSVSQEIEEVSVKEEVKTEEEEEK